MYRHMPLSFTLQLQFSILNTSIRYSLCHLQKCEYKSDSSSLASQDSVEIDGLSCSLVALLCTFPGHLCP